MIMAIIIGGAPLQSVMPYFSWYWKNGSRSNLRMVYDFSPPFRAVVCTRGPTAA